MESRKEIYNHWVQYTTKNDEQFFWEFIKGLVEVWESQLSLDWEHLPGWQAMKPDSGPHLSRLPEELLPAITKFTYIARDLADTNQLTADNLTDARYLLRCLIILCRHMDNIPLVASCDSVSQAIGLASTVVRLLTSGSPEMTEKGVDYFFSLCHLMECLYDPYFSWRNLINGVLPDFSKLTYQPSLLHVEVVPFLYDCFETELVQLYPKMCAELMHVLGAIISGAQSTLVHLSPLLERRGSRSEVGVIDRGHNALIAICPAMVNLTMNLVSTPSVAETIWKTALHCFVVMVRVLSKSSPEQRQIEVGSLICQAKEACLVIVEADTPPERIGMMLVQIISSFRLLMGEKQSLEAIRLLLLENHVMDAVVVAMDRSLALNLDHQLLAKECVWTLTAILKNSQKAKEKAEKSGILEGFLACVKGINPSRNVLRSFLSMTIEDQFEDNMDTAQMRIGNADIINYLISWIPSLSCSEQLWLATCLNHICSANLWCKRTASDHGVILKISAVLIEDKTLNIHTAHVLIRLVQNLAQHSFTPLELKHVLNLLDEHDEKKIPYRSQLVRALSVVSLRDELKTCDAFFDIQSDNQGISVPDISKWSSATYGFSLATWVRLSRVEAAETQRRQLFNLATSSGTGMQIFFRGDGAIVIGVTTKKEFLASCTVNQLLNNNCWHHVVVCFAAARRHFGQSQISVFVDGEQVLNVSLKFPSLNDQFVVCTLGTVAQRAPKFSCETTEKTGTVSTLISSSRLPNLMNLVPSHFTLPLRGSGVQDPLVKSFPLGIQDTVWGASTCLRGQLGQVALFHDVLNPSHVKTLFNSGANSRYLFSMDDITPANELIQKLVFCFSPLASWGEMCMDLAPGGKFPGHVTADLISTVSMKDAVSGVGGLPAFLPLLEQNSRYESGPDLSLFGPQTNIEMSDWTSGSNSAFADHKLEQNPVSAFLIILKNLIVHGHQESAVKDEVFGVAGYLMSRVDSQLLDVNVLMGVQLLLEAVRSSNHFSLLKAVYHHVLFNFKIWSLCSFPIRFAHVQYLTKVVKEDGKFLRKKYGVQFLLDTIRRYYTGIELLSNEDSKAIRHELLFIVKSSIHKDTNANQVSAVLKFLFAVKEECLLMEVLDMLNSYLESKHCRDQVYLLLYEPQSVELLYGILVEPEFTLELKQKIIKIFALLLRSDRVYEIYKGRLRLQDGSVISSSTGMAAGFISLLTQKPLSMEIVVMLFNQLLSVDNDNSYSAALILTHALSQADLAIKVEVAQKLLTTTFMRPGAPQLIAKQSAWQDSITRLLIKKPINVETQPPETPFPDLMTFEHEPAAPYDPLANTFEEVAGLLTDNINYAADNFSSVVASAYSVIRQKTVEIQETLEDARSRIVPGIGPDAGHDSSGSEDGDASNVSRSESCEPEEAEIVIEDDSLTIDDLTLQWEKLSSEKAGDREEELSYMVMNLLWIVLWRGIDGSSKDAWKQRGQVMTTINFLSLNNELFISHLTLKLQILEMAGEAALADLQKNTIIAVEHSENAAQLLRWIYDLVVVDPHEDITKKTSVKLLDIVLKMVDVFTIFQESPVDEWSDMVKLSLGILLQCSQSNQLELCARSTAKLHALLQTRPLRDINEGGYMLYVVNKNILGSFNGENEDMYSFLMPVMKTLLEKLSVAFTFPSILTRLPSLSSGPLFFEEFRNYCQTEEWTTFITNKIRPLYESYNADLEKELIDPMNVFWAECYEASQIGVAKRSREVMESKMRFQRQIIEPLRTKQAEEMARFNNVMSQERHQRWQMKKKWRLMKQFLMGPRGAWAKRNGSEMYWKLSHHENVHRMRLKLCPNLFFDMHINASNARDNTGWMSRGQSVDDMHVHFALPVVGRKDDEDEVSIDEDFGVVNDPEIEDHTSGKEKSVLSQECELVTLMTVVKGRLDITTTHIYFYDLRPVKEDVERLDFRCPLFKLREIYLRQYNLRRSAIEIFLIDQTNYFINFTPKTRNRILSSIYSLRPPNLVYFGNRSPADRLRSSGIMQRWINHEISNFDYLMQLNTLAGRSFNDLSQYPVFPWIIADYTCDVLDLNEPSTFRDLSKPIGIVNPRNEAEVKAKYEGFEDPNGVIAKFHYGTHYSNSAGVLHYLVRVEPFTSLHIELQSGRFDVADRQFHSISQTWRMLMDNPNDVKELIPEFFYLPEFLKNLNNFNLGLLQGSKQRVHDVILPPWASTPEEFISLHRKALESEYVSQNLHHWIDLIFGYKQKGLAAVEALNVFYYCSYEGAVDLDSIKNSSERDAIEGMINNFGQTPRQLLKEPHPQRLSWEATIAKLIKSEVKRLDFTLFLDNLANVCIKVSNDNDPIVYLSPPRSAPSRGLLPSGPFDNIITINQSGIIGCNSWSPSDKQQGFVFDVDASINNVKSRKKLPTSFPVSTPLNSKMFAVSLDGKLIFSVGHWDCSLQLFHVLKGKTVASVVHHFDLVTCVALDICGCYLVTGSRDTTCVLWDVSHICVPNSTPTGMLAPRALHVLHGHDAAVTCVGVVTELDMVVSGSLDGTVNVHTIQEGQYIRTLRPMEAGAGAVITFLALSNQGHVAFSAHDQMSHSVHVFSVNGVHVGSKYVDGQVTGLATAGDSLVVGDDAGDLTISRLLGLHPIYHIPLHVPIQSVVVAPGRTHLLAPLRDGTVVVIGIRNGHS